MNATTAPDVEKPARPDDSPRCLQREGEYYWYLGLYEFDSTFGFVSIELGNQLIHRVAAGCPAPFSAAQCIERTGDRPARNAGQRLDPGVERYRLAAGNSLKSVARSFGRYKK